MRVQVGQVNGEGQAELRPDPARFPNGLAIGEGDIITFGDERGTATVQRLDRPCLVVEPPPVLTFHLGPIYFELEHGLTWEMAQKLTPGGRRAKVYTHTFKAGPWRDTLCGLLKTRPDAILDPSPGGQGRRWWREVYPSDLDEPEERADRCYICLERDRIPHPWSPEGWDRTRPQAELG